MGTNGEVLHLFKCWWVPDAGQVRGASLGSLCFPLPPIHWLSAIVLEGLQHTASLALLSAPGFPLSATTSQLVGG